MSNDNQWGALLAYSSTTTSFFPLYHKMSSENMRSIFKNFNSHHTIKNNPPTPLKQHPLKATGICITSYQSDNTSAIILTSHATINPNNQPHKSIPPHKSQNLLKRKWSLKNIFKFLLQWQVATLNQEPPQIFFKVHTSFHPHGWQANLKELGHKRTLYI